MSIEPINEYPCGSLQVIESTLLEQFLPGEDIRIIFIWGWNGVGASAILKNVAQQLVTTRDPRVHFDKVVWLRLPTQQSPRLVQRMIAEALELHHSTMAKFDEHDEDDDFSGLTSDRRGIVQEISEVIYRSLKDVKFLLLVRNLGTTIDMNGMGIPTMTRWTGGKMLFTIQLQDGRTNMSIANSMAPQASLGIERWVPLEHSMSLQEEATEVADYINNISISGRRSTLTPRKILECFWYTMLVQSSLLNHNDQIIQMSSFLVLEGLIEEGDRGKEMADAVSQELQCQFMGPGVRERAEDVMISSTGMSRVWDETLPHRRRLLLLKPEWDGNAEKWEQYRWISVRLKHGDGIQQPPSNCPELSTLLLVECSPSTGMLPARMFEYMCKLRVLVLKDTNILFLPPSLLCLHDLRLLLLVGCKQLKTLSIPTNTTTAGYSSSTPQPQLQKLQVLIISQSNLQEIPRETLELMPNLEVMKLTDTNLQSIPDEPFERMQRLEVFDLSNNHQIESLPKGLLKAVSLKKLILGGCQSLKTLVPQLKHLLASMEEIDLMNCMSLQEVDVAVDGPLPLLHNLQTFRHSGSQITKISLRGCCRLKDVELSHLDQLEELDLSGTSIESLDPGVVHLPRLRRLVLLGCANLRNVPWDDFRRFPEEFYLDQLTKVSDNNYYITLLQQQQIGVQMFVRDARLFRQLSIFSSINLLIHIIVKFRICISPSIEESKHKGNSRGKKAATTTTDGFSSEPFPYRDAHKVIKNSFQGHPPPPPLDSHVEIIGGTQFPGDIKTLIHCSQSLHMHDDKSTRSLTDYKADLRHLQQCRIERCHNMDAMFSLPHPPHTYNLILNLLDSIWASDLRRLTAICMGGRFWEKDFSRLKHVYLEFCPRLKYVFPSDLNLENLETLHICYCDDLKDVFLEQRETEATDRLPDTLQLSRLRSIHLIELPQLECISKGKVHPTALQELKFRGCWSLRRLPFFIPPSTTTWKNPEVSCEKDWWDRLEWDGVEANHHSKLFRPHHAAYYKRPTKKEYL